MESIGVRELRQDASRYLARVEAGESFQVTSRGRPVAILGPTDPAQDARARLIAEGTLLPRKQPWILPVPLPAPAGSLSTAEALDEERAERL